MRTTLKYVAAIGFMATAFSTVGPVSANAGQIPGTTKAPVGVMQQAKVTSPDHQQGRMALDRRRHCVRWGYYRHHHRYCEYWRYY
jgi:hypothetical protein